MEATAPRARDFLAQADRLTELVTELASALRLMLFWFGRYPTHIPSEEFRTRLVKDIEHAHKVLGDEEYIGDS